MRIRVKACRKIPWIAMALQIKTRLWLGGVVGDASRIAFWPMPCSIWLSSVARPLQELLVVTAGWAAYPKSIRRVFREKALRQARQGRCRLLAWPGLLIGTVIKRTERKHVVEVVRRMAASVWRNEPSSFSPRLKARQCFKYLLY